MSISVEEFSQKAVSSGLLSADDAQAIERAGEDTQDPAQAQLRP